MFSILGILLTVFGLVTAADTEMYKKSMDLNVNLWTGLFMIAVAGVLLISLIVERKAAKKNSAEQTSAEPNSEEKTA